MSLVSPLDSLDTDLPYSSSIADDLRGIDVEFLDEDINDDEADEDSDESETSISTPVRTHKGLTKEALEALNSFSHGPAEQFDQWLTHMNNVGVKRVIEVCHNEDYIHQKIVTKNKIKSSDIRKNSFSDTEGHIDLVNHVIAQAMNDSTPLSVIMTISTFGASATPDLESVYDAYMFFKSGRVKVWAGLVGADSSPVTREFEKRLAAWIPGRGLNFGRAVVSSAICALDRDELYISFPTAVDFIYHEKLFRFWCELGGLDCDALTIHYNLRERANALRKEKCEGKFSKKHRIKHSTKPMLDLTAFATIHPVKQPLNKKLKRKRGGIR